MAPLRMGQRCHRRLTLLGGAAFLLLLLLIASPTPVNAQSGVLNTLTRALSASATPTSAAVAAASNAAIDLSDTRVPYVLERPAPAHVAHRGRPRVQNVFSQCSNLNGLQRVDPISRLNVSAVYAQYVDSPDTAALGQFPHRNVLRIVGVGAVGNQSQGASGGYFSAIQATTTFLTFNVFSNLTYLCDHVYPTSPDPEQDYIDHSTCLYGPGQVAFEVDIPLNATYQMGTLWTQILLIDYSQPAQVIACVEVPVSPYKDSEAWYWTLMFWLPVALFIGFFALVSLARAITAATTRARAFKNRAREGSAPSFLRDHLNPVIISALSGQGMVLSPALLRFSTPGCWDILFHLQFVAMLGMLAVKWPDFSYPFFQQAAWASLLGNVTLIQSDASSPIDPVMSNATLPTGDIGTQMGNESSILFMDAGVMPQSLLSLGANGDYTGISALATMIGLNDSLLFATCMAIWLIIVAIFLAVAIAGWVIDSIALAVTKIRRTRENRMDYQLANPDPQSQKEGELYMDADGNTRDARSAYYGFLGSWPRGFNPSPHLHWAALHGNIVRAVVMFHLPITILSVNQFANAGPNGFSSKSIILASVAFAIVSVLLPAYLLWRIAKSPARKLYDDIETLLALGPVYNTYSPGSQLFYAVTFAYSLVAGITVGAAQRSGSAQAIILLVLEVSQAFASMLWLPWGEGAMMGPMCFLTSILRVGTIVLVLLLTPLVDFSTRASAWITYVVLLLQGIFFGVATLVFLVKLLEATVRMLWRVAYDEKLNARSGGLGGAIRSIRKRRHKADHLAGAMRSKRASSSGTISMSYRDLAQTEVPSIKRGDSLSGRSSLMFVGGDVYAGPRDTNIALTRSRQASFASYLDFANAANVNSSLASGRPPPFTGGGWPASATSPGGEFLTSAGAYHHHSPYERGDEEEKQMLNGPAPLSRSPNEVVAAPIVDFQPVEGRRGRRGEEKGGKRSASGKEAAELSSTAAAASFARKQSRREARLAASASGKSKTGVPPRRHSYLLSRRRQPSEEDHITDEEDESNLGGTWGTSTLSTQHGPWNGLAKMQAALSNWKEKLGGAPSGSGEQRESEGRTGPLGGIMEEAGNDSPGSPSGFQVIRATPRGRVSKAQPPVGDLNLQMDLAQDSNDRLLDSTAFAAIASSSRPPSSLARSGGRQNSASPSAFAYSHTQTDDGRRSSTGNGLTIIQDRHQRSGTPGTPSTSSRPLSATAASYYDPSTAFGILGADLARALSSSSSEGSLGGEHSGAARGDRGRRNEERFWRPPNRSGGGEGVFSTAAAGAAAAAASPMASGTPVNNDHRRTGRIELVDPDEENR